METKIKKPAKGNSKNAAGKIPAAYISYILDHGTKPVSVFRFCSDTGIPENEFYNHFGSFEGVEKHIWKDFIHTTIQRLKADKAYPGFSSREKLLAFYFTFFEGLKLHRSFILVQLSNYRKIEIVPEFLKDFKKEFETYIHSVLSDGKANGEIANRPLLDKSYPVLFWMHMGFMLTFWKDDNSAGFEQTDAAIEKSVNLAFDLISKGAVDAVIDFAKFMYQTKVK